MWTNGTIHYAISDAVKWKILAVPKIPRVEKVAHFENDIAGAKIAIGSDTLPKINDHGVILFEMNVLPNQIKNNSVSSTMFMKL